MQIMRFPIRFAVGAAFASISMGKMSCIWSDSAMPVTFSFEIDAAPYVSNQIGSLFERLGWERLDARTLRYPRMDEQADGKLENWFNHVVPALMLFRSYVLTKGLAVKSLTLDARSSTGYRRDSGIGSPPLQAEQVPLYEPSPTRSQDGGAADEHSSEEWALLAEWLRGVDFPEGL
jgi:hypothetical protein